MYSNHRRSPGGLIFFFLFLALFGFITFSVIRGFAWVRSFDLAIQNAAFSLRNDILTAILIPLTYSGNWQGVTAICVLLLLIPRTRKWFGVPLTGSALASMALYESLKYLIQRVRPDVSVHLIEQGGYSFPSGHTLSSLMVWGTLILLLIHYQKTSYISPLASQQVGPAARFRAGRLHRPSLGAGLTIVLCVVAAVYLILMGLSRIYVGVHWPTDVLGSWCLGLAMLVPIRALVTKL